MPTYERMLARLLEPGDKPLLQNLVGLRPEMAAAAQAVYDGWTEEEGMFGTAGGICDEVAEAIGGVIASNISDVELTDFGHEGDDHAAVIAYNRNEAYLVDIPASTYETGSGYSWAKIPDVRFGPEDVLIEPVDRPE